MIDQEFTPNHRKQLYRLLLAAPQDEIAFLSEQLSIGQSFDVGEYRALVLAAAFDARLGTGTERPLHVDHVIAQY